MKTRVFLTTTIVALFCVLMIARFGVLSVPAAVDLLFGENRAPFDIFMLMTLAAMMLLYLILLAVAEGSSAVAQRLMSSEVERWRRLADLSEESRFADLRAHVDKEFADLHAKLDGIAARPEPPTPSEGNSTQRP